MNSLVNIGEKSPWGRVYIVNAITPSLTWVVTASHGGIKLSNEYNKLIPSYLRKRSGWYEEDCEAAYVLIILEDQIKSECFEEQKISIHKSYEHNLNQYLAIFRRYMPEKFERYIKEM